VRVHIEGRAVTLRVWRYDIVGRTGFVVPVFLLDAHVATPGDGDLALTDWLYGGDERYRLCQETILGIGGEEVLWALGLGDVDYYHMNEGHSALLVAALLQRHARAQGRDTATREDLPAVRRRCTFTTHTPLPAGHDRFDLALATGVLGPECTTLLERIGAIAHDELNMTHLALLGAGYVNAVALAHGQTSRRMFAGHTVHAITNGVHAPTWTSPPFAALYDRLLPDWRSDNSYLRYAAGIPADDIRAAHAQAKAALFVTVRDRTGVELDPNAFWIGFARRATGYKRMTLPFSDLARLRAIAASAGPLAFIFGGKAHPRDETGKRLIREVFAAAAELGDAVRVVYLENYDVALARSLVAGVDLWLNTPEPPLEASGTSGMKAALNGVPSLSVLDGWWIEGHVEGVTGWSIGDGGHSSDASDARSLYRKLERVILPLFMRRPDGYARVMRSTIALNGSFFNAQRMLEQYAAHAYLPRTEPA